MKKQGITRSTLTALAFAAAGIALSSCTQPMGNGYSQYGNSYPDPYNPAYGSSGGQQQSQGGYGQQQQQVPSSQGGYYGGNYPQQQPQYPQSQGGYPNYGGDGAQVEPVYEQPSYNPPAQSSSSSSSSASTSSRSHTVKKGETLWRLSQKYGTSVSAIKKANGIPSGSNIIVTGSRIKIP